jgi:hypothetical protein
MASRGVCCAAQAAGDLGKPLVVDVHTASGIKQRCGVCEVRPSCHNPQKLVFAFRFLKNAACALPGTAHCAPTAAGIAQYNAERTAAARTGQIPLYEHHNGAVTFAPYAHPGIAPSPYQLP